MLKINNRLVNSIFISVILGFSLFIVGKNYKIQNSIPTSSLPTSEHIIVLDAGHGQPDRTVQLVKMESPKKK